MLWRRYYAETEVAGKAKRREEAHESGRQRRSAAGSLPGNFESGRRMSPDPNQRHLDNKLSGSSQTREQASLSGAKLADHSDRIGRKSLVREYAEAIIVAMLLAFAIRVFVVQAFKIPSGSMIPTLLIGDHILVSKLAYGIQWPSDCKFQVTFPPVNCYASHAVIEFGKPQRG